MDRLLTIRTAAASFDLTTLDSVKVELGITDQNSDEMLSTRITRASAAAARYCKREFIAEAVTEQFRSYPFIDSASLVNIPEFIYLRRRPIISLDAVLQPDDQSLSLASVIEDAEPLIEGIDFEVDYAAAKLTRLHGDRPTCWRFRKLTIATTAGYTFPGTLPPDVEAAVSALVNYLWFTAARDPTIRAQNIPGVLETQWWVGPAGVTDFWPPQVVDYLAPYVETRF
jgi:hypothetical protein